MAETKMQTDQAKETPAARIKELNDIDADISQLLRSAGDSLKLLGLSNEGEGQEASLDARKAALNESSDQFYSLLSSVSTRMQDQILALRNANVISSGAPLAESNAGAVSADGADPAQAKLSDVGVGSLGVGWLNSRTDTVGKEMEASLWAEAKAHLEKLEVRPKTEPVTREVSHGTEQQTTDEVSMEDG